MDVKTPVTQKHKQMDFLKTKLAVFGRSLKKNFLFFPVTQGSIWLFTLLFVVLIDADISSDGFWESVLLFLIFFGIGCFFTEALYQRNAKKWLRLSLYAVSALPAFLFAWLLSLESDATVLSWDYDTIAFYLPRYVACYVLVLFSLAVYFCYRAAKLSLEEYLTRFFAWAVRVSILYFVLIIGVGMVLGIFQELFDADYDLFIKAQFLLFGLFYVSSLLRGMLPDAREEDRFAEILVKYVLTGLVISTFAIIYIYILKILLFRDMPSNAVFRILTGLFLAGLPIWTMNSFYTQHNPLLKISRILPYLFSPLILLQAYSIGIRIYENGITPMRYVCVMLLVFEIIYVTLYYFRKQAVSRLFLVFAIFVFAACCVPGINMFRISILSQQSALRKYMETPASAALSQREIGKAAGAYWYLYDDLDGSAYLKNLPEEKKQKLESLREGDKNEYHEIYDFYQSEETAVIDVAGYRYCYPIQESSRNGIDGLTEYTLAYGEGRTESFNFKAYLDGFLELEKYSEESRAYFGAHREIAINADTRLFLEYLSFDYDLVTEEYTHLSFRGYLLKKE